MDEKLDILEPPLFTPSGIIKTREQAYRDGDWVGTFNLWIVSRDLEPAIIFQQRSMDRDWAPGKLDVAAGGHLLAGEEILGGLREAEEELGRVYTPEQLTFLGRKLYVGRNNNGSLKQNIVNIYLVEDDAPLSAYSLQESEVYAICRCPVSQLLKAHRDAEYSFKVEGLTAKGETIDITVNKAMFPVNYDDYHYKIAVLADRYFKGETDLLY